MIERVLPYEEWPKLDGTLLGPVWPNLDPSRSTVLVVESEDGEILATTVMYIATHLEGAWVHPDYRHNVAVGRHLLNIVREHIAAADVNEVLTMSVDPGEIPMGVRLGLATKLDGDHYAVKVQ